MIFVFRNLCLLLLCFSFSAAFCQPENNGNTNFALVVTNERTDLIEGANVQMINGSKVLKIAVTDKTGAAVFENIPAGDYIFSISYTGYLTASTKVYYFPSLVSRDTVILKPANKTLEGVNITARKPFIEQKQGKVILNVANSVTAAGSTVLEVLEKSPGVMVDRNGGIALKGKQNVLVLVDDKPTYLTGADLNNLLSSMNAAQVDQIELISNPSAKYDASGNAGVINIKTKKNKQKGFNGTATASFGQGVYPKSNNNLSLNYRDGKISTFFTYSISYVKYLTDLYALRKYYGPDGELQSQLKQPSYFSGDFTNNTAKAGLDYAVGPKTTVGVVVGGTAIQRQGNNKGQATWMEPSGTPDSAITTINKNTSSFRNGSINLNARHSISSSQDLALDIDWLHYGIKTNENFDNQFIATNGYDEVSRGSIPTTINITSGKLDYTLKFGKEGTFLAGVKSSHSSTDNLASYQNLDNGVWVEDNTKNNHFIYNENIHAIYSDVQGKLGKWTAEAGVRYEHTGYNANQLGNAIQADSAFSRNYGGFFPSGNISYQADTANGFTFTAGRRIDRPVFQTLNPFYFIINKYTYQTGNPFLLPQYSWNLELSHQYKQLLTTSVSYGIITNYFSQLFLDDAAHGVLLYSQGNVGRTTIWGVTSALSVSPTNWWQLNFQAVYNHKELAGFNGNNFTSNIDQLNINTTNQFIIAKIYTAELSGFYTTKARNDIQERLYPTGQLSIGLSRPLLNKKATIKLTARDIFYTNAMEGLTQFPNATEYFKIKRDSRVVVLAFTYRFGKSYKAARHNSSSASDEADRVGSGG